MTSERCQPAFNTVLSDLEQNNLGFQHFLVQPSCDTVSNITEKFCSLTKLSLDFCSVFCRFLVNPASFAHHITATSPPPPTHSSLSLPLLFPSHILDLSSLTPATSQQARMELRRLKQEARNKHAVTIIWAYWQGTKVFQPQLWCISVPAVLSSLFTVSCPIPITP